MKSVKLSLLAVVVATIVSPSAFADDTVEAAATELTAIRQVRPTTKSIKKSIAS